MNIKLLEDLKEAWKKDPEFKKAFEDNLSLAFRDRYHKYQKETKKVLFSVEDICTIATDASENFVKFISGELKHPKKPF